MTAAALGAPSAAHVPALDGVRGIAILAVVVMHAGLPAVALDALVDSPLLHGYLSLALLGWCGVDVFFVLSGFLITGILLRAKGQPHYFRNFYARRALRIFPLYYLVIALLLWVLPRGVTSVGEQLSYLAYYQNLRWAWLGEVSPDPVLLVTWSLAIEEQFYLAWPAVVAWLHRRLATCCIVIAATAIALRFVLVQNGFAYAYFLTPCRLDALVVGALLAMTPPLGAGTARTALLGGAFGLLAIAWWVDSPLPQAPAMQGLGLVAALLLAVGVLSLARRDGAFARCCRHPVLRAFGRYSYCIYLTHLLVIETLLRWQHAALADTALHWPLAHTLAFTVVCAAVSWCVGWFSWHCFEQWFLRLKRAFPSGGSADR